MSLEVVGAAAAAAAVALLIVFKKREADSELSFTTSPSKFHKKVICIDGKVKKILRTPLVKRLARNLVLKRGETHQRFLVVSPKLLPGKAVLVLNNLKFDRAPIREGAWVRVQGEYIHKKGKTYGRIHYTHEPKGEVIVHRKRPDKLVLEVK